MRKYYTDGHTIGTGGYTIMDSEGVLITTEKAKVIDGHEAEILGILAALEICEKGDCVSTDSMAALSSLNVGRASTKPHLNDCLQKGYEMMYEKGINLMWERREFNLAGQFNERMLDYVRNKEGKLPVAVIEELSKKKTLKIRLALA